MLAIQRHLRDVARYRLDSPVPGPGRDAVDHFLFDARSGFCEQFASAEVVLLRAAGIPARLVTGFSGGAPSDPGRRSLRAADAHAWVEVWFPGRGWVSSDPTAGSRPEVGWQRRVQQGVQDLAHDARGRAVLVLVALAALALLTGAGLLLARWLRAGGEPPATHVQVRAAHGVPPALLAAFERLEAALAKAGRPRAEHESLADLAARWPDDTAAGDALRTLERTLYGPIPPSPAEVMTAVQYLDRLSAAVLAADLAGASSLADPAQVAAGGQVPDRFAEVEARAHRGAEVEPDEDPWIHRSRAAASR